MNILVERLILLGYNAQEAEKIYAEYERRNELSSLYGYVNAKEQLLKTLEG